MYCRPTCAQTLNRRCPGPLSRGGAGAGRTCTSSGRRSDPPGRRRCRRTSRRCSSRGRRSAAAVQRVALAVDLAPDARVHLPLDAGVAGPIVGGQEAERGVRAPLHAGVFGAGQGFGGFVAALEQLFHCLLELGSALRHGGHGKCQRGKQSSHEGQSTGGGTPDSGQAGQRGAVFAGTTDDLRPVVLSLNHLGGDVEHDSTRPGRRRGWRRTPRSRRRRRGSTPAARRPPRRRSNPASVSGKPPSSKSSRPMSSNSKSKAQSPELIRLSPEMEPRRCRRSLGPAAARRHARSPPPPPSPIT